MGSMKMPTATTMKGIGKHVGGPLAADAVSATITAGLISKKMDKNNAAQAAKMNAGNPNRVGKKARVHA